MNLDGRMYARAQDREDHNSLLVVDRPFEQVTLVRTAKTANRDPTSSRRRDRMVRVPSQSSTG